MKQFKRQLSEWWLLPIAVLLLTVKISALFLQHLHAPPFSSDSWVYFELSKHLFADFYHVNGIRQFEYLSEYGVSFPPLYPFLLWLLSHLGQSSIYAGYLVNFGLLLVLIPVMLLVSKKVTSLFLPGIFLLGTLINHQDFLSELLSGRSIVLSLLLTLCLVLFFLQRQNLRVRTIGLAVCAGLLSFNRFDFVLPSIVLGVVLYFSLSQLKKVQRLKQVGIYLATFMIVISPWVLYSMTHFSKPYVSDNARTVLVAQKIFTTDYFPASTTPKTIFSDPGRWLLYRVVFTGGVSFGLFLINIFTNPQTQQLLFANAILLVLLGSSSKTSAPGKKTATQWYQFRQLCYLAPVLVAQLATASLTGFLDMRYTLHALLWVQLLLVSLAVIQLKQVVKSTFVIPVGAVLIVISTGTLILSQFHGDYLKVLSSVLSYNQELLEPKQHYQEIMAVMLQEQVTPVLLVDEHNQDGVDPSQFAAQTNLKTLVTPNNLNETLLPSLVSTYGVTHLYTDCPLWTQALAKVATVVATEQPHLYAIYRVGTPSAVEASTVPSIVPDPSFRNCTRKLL